MLIFRMWRFFRWVDSFERYKLIFRTLTKLAPLFLDLLGVLTIAFYFYASVGELLFGGQLKTNLPVNFSQYGNPAYYVYVNFNDFCNGLFTCFHLLIVNNWLYTVSIIHSYWLCYHYYMEIVPPYNVISRIHWLYYIQCVRLSVLIYYRLMCIVERWEISVTGSSLLHFTLCVWSSA